MQNHNKLATQIETLRPTRAEQAKQELMTIRVTSNQCEKAKSGEQKCQSGGKVFQFGS